MQLRCARHLKRACDAITFIGKMYIYTKFLKKSLVFVYFKCFTDVSREFQQSQEKCKKIEG